MFHTDISINLIYMCVCVYIILDKRNKLDANSYMPTHICVCVYWRRKWQPTPVFLPGESHGQRSLVGCCLWGRKELDMTERLSMCRCFTIWANREATIYIYIYIYRERERERVFCFLVGEIAVWVCSACESSWRHIFMMCDHF